MIVLSIIAILVTINVPSFVRFASNHRAAVAANDLMQAIASARSEAITRNRRVYLAPRGERWRDGWALFIDRNGNRTYDGPSSSAPDETIGVHDALPPTVDIVKPTGSGEPFTDVGSPRRAYILFDGNGYPRQRSGALSFGSFLVVDRIGDQITTRTICIASYGRVRVVVDRATC